MKEICLAVLRTTGEQTHVEFQEIHLFHGVTILLIFPFCWKAIFFYQILILGNAWLAEIKSNIFLK